MDIQKMFFTFEGRLNRKPYFFGNLALGLVSALCTMIMDNSDSGLISILGAVIGIALIIASVSLIIKKTARLGQRRTLGADYVNSDCRFLFRLVPVICEGN